MEPLKTNSERYIIPKTCALFVAKAKEQTQERLTQAIHNEALDFVMCFIDMRFKQPNFKGYKQLKQLLLEALAALASNDFADAIENLRQLTMLVLVFLHYYEKSVFQQSNELPKSRGGGYLSTVRGTGTCHFLGVLSSNHYGIMGIIFTIF